jgi:phosphopantothenoylcysteine decarboxylase
MSDNLLCSVIRAWDTDSNIDGKKKIIAVAPAMNSVTTPPSTPSHTMHH